MRGSRRSRRRRSVGWMARGAASPGEKYLSSTRGMKVGTAARRGDTAIPIAPCSNRWTQAAIFGDQGHRHPATEQSPQPRRCQGRDCRCSTLALRGRRFGERKSVPIWRAYRRPAERLSAL